MRPFEETSLRSAGGKRCQEQLVAFAYRSTTFLAAAMGNPTGGSFCHLLWIIDRPPRREGFLVEGVGNFLRKGSRKTP